ncbi:MAG: VOC family protein [Acidobacteria bacterium]|nr:VOC family protein [Acidobacteriota bacterium]
MLYSRDVAQAVYFYVDLLGFRLIEQVGHGGMLVYARIRSPRGSSTLALHLLEPGKTLPVDDAVRLYFEVRNVGAMCKKLQATGVKLLGEPKVMPWGWKHAYLKDPDGHELSLYWAGPKRFRKTMSG